MYTVKVSATSRIFRPTICRLELAFRVRSSENSLRIRLNCEKCETDGPTREETRGERKKKTGHSIQHSFSRTINNLYTIRANVIALRWLHRALVFSSASVRRVLCNKCRSGNWFIVDDCQRHPRPSVEIFARKYENAIRFVNHLKSLDVQN